MLKTYSNRSKIIFVLYFFILFGILENTAKATKTTFRKENEKNYGNQVYNEKKLKSTQIGLIIEDYVNQKWDPDESVCYDKTLLFLNGINNSTLWALWMWDAMQYPVGFLHGYRNQLGDYDECLKTPWSKTHPPLKTQYCLAEVKLSSKDPTHLLMDPYTSTENYINSITKFKIKYNSLTWGLCIPSECEPKSVTKFASVLLKRSYLGTTVPNFEISIESCQTGDRNDLPLKLHVLIVFFLVMNIVICCSVLNSRSMTKSDIADLIGNELINACCLERNAKDLFKSPKDDIKVMHGIRIISSVLLILVHVLYMNIITETSNTSELENVIGNYNFIHLERCVDTYLLLSAILMIRSLMVSKKFNPMIVILNRYIRLALPVAVLQIIIIQLGNYTGDGPTWTKFFGKEIRKCQETWWIGILMLGNYVDTSNICYPSSWTVPCDFHLSVVCVMLFWIYRKNRCVGIITFLALSFAALLLPGLVTYEQGLNAAPIFNIETITNYRDHLFMSPTYLRSHLRAGTYFVGGIVGYLLSSCKSFNREIKISKKWSIIGFIVSLTILFLILLKSFRLGDVNTPYDAMESALFASFSRPLWGLAISCIIIVCEYGTVPIIGLFLKSPMFLPLSKLNYGIYLAHTGIIFYISMYITQKRFNSLLLLPDVAGVLAVSCLLSSWLYLFFEAPVRNVLKIITDTRGAESKKEDFDSKTVNCKRKNE